MNNIKDLLLIKPKTSYNLQSTPPLGLGFISSYVKKAGYSVSILDCNVQNIPPEKLQKKVNLHQFRLIGLQAFDMDLLIVNGYLRVIKHYNPEIPTVVGGPAPSSSPHLVSRFIKNADFFVVGEGELAVRGLLDHVEPGPVNVKPLENVPNLAWFNGNDLHFTGHQYMSDLDIIGPPDWDEINPRLYKNAVHGFFYKRLPVLPILVSRGCPFDCSFCGGRKITGYKIRRRSSAAVVDELKYLRREYNLAEFQIVDDNFTAPPNAAQEFADKLLRSKLDLFWSLPNGVRVDTLNRQLLEAMKNAGCYEMAVGIESGAPSILKAMNKKLKPETVEEKLDLISSVGINITGFVMVGYPGETQETLKRTIDFVLKLPLVRISLTRFVPLSGTPITNQLIAEGQLKEEDLDPTKLNYGNFTYISPSITENRLRYLYLYFFFRFLLRPKIIWHNIRSIMSISHAIIIFKKLLWFLK